MSYHERSGRGEAKRFGPIYERVGRLVHGGDYNPDQWLGVPGVLDEDSRLMGLAGCNAMSVGIFAWSALEPSEGRFEFDWLDRVMDRLWGSGVHVIDQRGSLAGYRLVVIPMAYLVRPGFAERVRGFVADGGAR